jgi:hypothetical protein
MKPGSKIPYDVAMKELQTMFEELDRELIHTVLVEHGTTISHTY